MPIQIKELIIRATVSEQPESAISNGSSADTQDSKQEKIREQTIRHCVDEVLEILRLKSER